MKKLFVLLISLTLCLISLFSTACGGTPKEIGIQLADRYTDGQVARCIWDLYHFNDKIYMGGGDYDKNSGPTDICAYNLKTKKIEITGRINDEAVLNFVEIDGKLYAPGTDPQGSGLKSDYYSLEESGWEKHTVLLRAIHNFDLIKFDGILYAGIGGDNEVKTSPILISNDNGETFEFMDLYKNGEILPPLEAPNFSRCYDFYTLNNVLYALICHTYSNGYDFEIYRLEDGKMQFFSDADTISITKRPSVRIMSAKAEYDSKVYIATNYLYSSTDGGEFTKIPLPNDETVSDFFIDDDVMYLLSFVKGEADYNVTLYSYNLKNAEFKSLTSFNYAVPPLSFVKVEKDFYIGMGNKSTPHEKNGALLKIRV